MSDDLNRIADDPTDAVPAASPKKRGRKPKHNGGDEKAQQEMSAARIIELAKEACRAAPDPLNRVVKAPDPYDPDRYTENVDFTKLAATRPFISQLPVRKPAPDDYVRTHPTIMFANVPLCAPTGEKGQLYLLDHSNEELFADMLKYSRNYFLFYTVTKEGKLSLWPIVGPHPDTETWHQSPRTAAQVAERARTEWVQIEHKDGLGYVGTGPRDLIVEPPAFPDFSRRRLLELAFRPYTIKDYDHPYVRRCLGLNSGTVENKR